MRDRSGIARSEVRGQHRDHIYEIYKIYTYIIYMYIRSLWRTEPTQQPLLSGDSVLVNLSTQKVWKNDKIVGSKKDKFPIS